MPGYVIHLAIASEYCKKNNISDNERIELLKGSIAPDGVKDKSVTHYGYDTAHPNLRNYLASNEPNTSFNKGYFLHLLSDFVFYNYYYQKALMAGYIFHNDFDTINRALIEHYQVQLPERLAQIVKFSDKKPDVIDLATVMEMIDSVSSLDLETVVQDIKSSNTLYYQGKQVDLSVPEKDPRKVEINHVVLQNEMNQHAHQILSLIKADLYGQMSSAKRNALDSLIEIEDIIIVNHGVCQFNNKLLAHGGRALKDNKIHYYPDARSFSSNEEALEKCKRILPHEIFHYFIQPDNIPFTDQEKKDHKREMARFYTEGLVEKEARAFAQRHPEIPFQKALYEHNIEFVNAIQGQLNATEYETIFSESEYLGDIGKYKDVYKVILERREKERNLKGEEER